MLRFAFNFFLTLLILVVISSASVIIYILPGLPDIETLRDVKLQIPLRVYTKDGALISEYGEKRRTPIKIDNVSKQMINALLSTEDDRFFEHPGVDWRGIRGKSFGTRENRSVLMRGPLCGPGSTTPR